MFNSVADRFKGTLPQFVAVITGTLMAISDGMQFGYSAPVTPLFLSPESPVQATELQIEWLETILMVGAFCGLPITMFLVDRIGRKKCLILSSCVSLVAWIVMALANRAEYMIAARFFAGMAGDMAFVAAPMYVAEIADQKVRGFMSSIIYLMMFIGIILVYLLVPYVSYLAPSVLGVILLAIEIVVFPFMPDSPYYLLQKNKPEEAKAALARLRQNKNVDDELIEITEAVKRQTTEKGRIQDMILVKSNRKALLIMAVLNSAQHMSALSPLLMNLHSILEEAGSVSIDTNSSALIMTCIMFVTSLVASFLMDHFGRRVLLVTSSSLTGLCLICIATYFTLKNNDVDVSNCSWLPAAAIMTFAVTFRLGVGMVPIVMTAELFPVKMKAIGMTIADSWFILSSIISLQVYHILRNAYGIHVPFFVFTFCAFFCTWFTIFVVPETKGKSLEEIQFMLKGEVMHKEEAKENGTDQTRF